MEQVNYSLGFVFSHDKSHVLLVKKNHPEWQKGKYNGLGGKLESTDRSLYACMSREFKEETGVDIDPGYWKMRGVMKKSFPRENSWLVGVFTSTMPLHQLKKLDGKVVEGEELRLFTTSLALTNPYIIPNLKWLIQLVLSDQVQDFNITY